MISPPSLARPKILFVDDELKACKYFSRLFGDNYEVIHTIDPKHALVLAEEHPDVRIVVSDQRMPELMGTEFLSRFEAINSRAVRVLSTAYSDYESVVEAINLAHVFAYLAKPWEVDFVNRTLARALEVYEKGNPEGSNLQINEIRPSDLSNISISLEDVPDVQAILSMSQSILSKRSEGGDKDQKINLVRTPEDLMVIFGSSTDDKEHVASLSSFRKHYELLDDAHRAIVAPHSPRLSVKHAEATLTTIGHSNEAQSILAASEALAARNTLDGLQAQLAKLAAEIYGLTRMQSLRAGLRMNKLKTDLEGLINETRGLCSAENIGHEALAHVIAASREFLDDVNNNRNGLRELLISGYVDPAHLTVIFILFNGLPQRSFTARMEPDIVMMNLARTARDKVENRSLLIVSAVLFLPVLGLILHFVQSEGDLNRKILGFALVVFLSLISGAAATSIIGKLGVDGNFPIPLTGGKSMSVKGTSGFAMFLLVFAVGTHLVA